MRLASLSAGRFIFVLAAMLVVGCNAHQAPAHAAAKPPEIAVDHGSHRHATAAECPDHVDVAALFARNGEAFGLEERVSKNAMTLTGLVSVSGKDGTFEQSFDPKRARHSIHVKGFERASGIDENGAWRLGNSGAISRLRPDETRDTDEWILRRQYMSAFDPKRDAAVCHGDGKKAQIIIHEKIAELGSPRLVFDADSAALIGAEFTGVDGTMSTRSYVWDGGTDFRPRFPIVSTAQDGDGATIEERFQAMAAATADAFALPAPTLEVTWPKSGNVRVPMKLSGEEIFLDVVIGGKKARALLDSSAGISIVDPSGKAADAFITELELGGGSALVEQPHLGIGKLAEIHIGGLVVKNISAARVPIPAEGAPSSNRPDVVIGWALFEGNAVRIDYARNELVFSRDSSSAHAADAAAAAAAAAIDLHVWSDRMIAPVKFADRPAPVSFQIATGKPFALAVSETWAKRNQFGSASLAYAMGPIAASSDPIGRYEGVDTGSVAGLLGDHALAKCAAVTFDVPNRKLWLEGACNRAPLAR